MGVWWGFMFLVVVMLLGKSSDEVVRAPLPPVVAEAAPAREKAAPPRNEGEDLLAGRVLAVPVQGVARTKLRDTFDEKRGTGRKHEAIDIMAPWGTPVVAADDGVLAKIASNRGGGLTLYQVDPSGRLVYYYAHLAGYADGLREGQALKRGEVIGFVGATGNAPKSAPHLHFAVLVLAREKRWWGGEAINPYAALARAPALTAAR